MNSAFDRLQTASHKLAEVIYNQTSANTGNAATEEQASSASAGGDATTSSTSGSSDDNVIDAEYVDVDEDKK
jgi:molecular chaperone DnaK